MRITLYATVTCCLETINRPPPNIVLCAEKRAPIWRFPNCSVDIGKLPMHWDWFTAPTKAVVRLGPQGTQSS